IMIGTKDDGFEFTVEKVDDNAIEDVRIVRFKKEDLQKKSKK
ncbi:MAG: hypothetical protein QG650_1070, partial [Patescibacteria group bacterium]|nr:hypothetical protein [Patescibacteria group bacterium]